MSKNVKREVKKFVPTTEEVFKAPLLSLLEGKTFFISRIEFDESKEGEYAVLDILEDLDQDKPVIYRTSGRALLNQLKQIKKDLTEDGAVTEVKLDKVQGKDWKYLSFVEF